MLAHRGAHGVTRPTAIFSGQPASSAFGLRISSLPSPGLLPRTHLLLLLLALRAQRLAVTDELLLQLLDGLRVVLLHGLDDLAFEEELALRDLGGALGL